MQKAEDIADTKSTSTWSLISRDWGGETLGENQPDLYYLYEENTLFSFPASFEMIW